jgi:hypothetical protein
VNASRKLSVALLVILPLSGCGPQTIEPTSQPADRTGKTEVFNAPPWQYRYTVRNPGTRSEGFFGALFHDGQPVPVPDAVNRYHTTPWGRITWVGHSDTPWGNHGWMPPERLSPEAAAAAKPLPPPMPK